MKKLKNSYKNRSGFLKKASAKLITKLVLTVNQIIEHRLFQPVVIAIITSFILAEGFNFGKNLIADYRESSAKKHELIPIKISISGRDVNFNIEEEQVEYRVKPGDTILKILVDLGVAESDIFNILTALRTVYNPRLINTGDQINIKYKLKIAYASKQETPEQSKREITITHISILPNSEKKIIISRSLNGEYQASEVKINLRKQISRYSGTLKNGFFVDGIESGISPTSMMNMIKLYSYDVDFQRDIKSGDKFEMLVESFYNEEGKKVKDGDVLFSSLTLRNKAISIYMHKVGNQIEYFDSKGNSVRKSLLKTPINGARISSGFGMRRHPILGYSRMHQGIDFAASTGTPILAAGSGIITYYGRKGGYGNFVQIKHNSDYSTAYGHASRFVKKLRVGSKIKQGDVVAFVGSTGRSTGPHLHFEVIYRGKTINPAKVKATSGLRLIGKELSRFKANKDEIDNYRKNIPNQIR